MGLVKCIVLHVISAGFLAAGVAWAASDAFLSQWSFAMAAGAFAVAWMLPDPVGDDEPAGAKKSKKK